jgi:hypothetical protein
MECIRNVRVRLLRMYLKILRPVDDLLVFYGLNELKMMREAHTEETRYSQFFKRPRPGTICTRAFEEEISTGDVTHHTMPSALILIADGTEEMELYAANPSTTTSDPKITPALSPTTPSFAQVLLYKVPSSLISVRNHQLP